MGVLLACVNQDQKPKSKVQELIPKEIIKQKGEDLNRGGLDDSGNWIDPTFRVKYTYWQKDGGPFMGLCGDQYALVFLGTIKEIKKKIRDKKTGSYTSQRGFLNIDRVLFQRDLKKEKFNKQSYFTSDCFYKTKFNKGDKVLVFCYEYEGGYSIPGPRAILNLEGENDPVLKSIESYIESGQKAITLRPSIDLWEKLGYEKELNQMLDCLN